MSHMKIGGQAGRQAINIFERILCLFFPFLPAHKGSYSSLSLNLPVNRFFSLFLFRAPVMQLLGGLPSLCAGKNNLGGEKWQKRTM